jgi:hypothetical protein
MKRMLEEKGADVPLDTKKQTAVLDFSQLFLTSNTKSSPKMEEKKNIVPPTPKINTQKFSAMVDTPVPENRKPTVVSLLQSPDGSVQLGKYISGISDRVAGIKTRITRKLALSTEKNNGLSLEESIALDTSIQRDERREKACLSELKHISEALGYVVKTKQEFYTLVIEDDEDEESVGKEATGCKLLKTIADLRNMQDHINEFPAP